MNDDVAVADVLFRRYGIFFGKFSGKCFPNLAPGMYSG